MPFDFIRTARNSGDAVALADDEAGVTHATGAERCHPISPLGARLLAASNAFFSTSKLWHAPDGVPPAKPFTSRHANYKPRCHD